MKTDKLFVLIKSLQKSEKIFFKKNAGLYRKEGASNYLKLFDAIDKQVDYDEKKLLSKFKGSSVAKYFSVSKNYLYESILKSLRTFRQGKSLKDKVQALQEEATILIEKGLNKEALSMIKKAKKIAYSIDYFTGILELIVLERSLTGTIVKLSAAINQKISKEREAILARLQRQHEVSTAYHEISFMNRNYQFLRSGEDLMKIKTLIQQPLFETIDNMPSFHSKLHYYYAWAIYYQLTSNHELEWENKRQLMLLWDAYPQMKGELERKYTTSLTIYASSCHLNDKTDELWNTIQVIEQFESQNNIIAVKMFFQLITCYCYYFDDSLDLEKWKAAIPKFEAELDRYNDPRFILIKRAAYLNILRIYIILGEYESAQNYSLLLNQLPKSEVHQDAQYLAQLFSLVVYFKLEQEEQIQSLCRSIEYKINKDDNAYQYEHLLLKFFRKLAQTPKYEQGDCHKAYLEKFEALKAIEYEQDAFNRYFNIILWIKAELRNTSMFVLRKEQQQH